MKIKTRSYKDGLKCSNCGWEQNMFFQLGEMKFVCGDCFANELANNKYDIRVRK